jgi:hypothetical protein
MATIVAMLPSIFPVPPLLLIIYIIYGLFGCDETGN